MNVRKTADVIFANADEWAVASREEMNWTWGGRGGVVASHHKRRIVRRALSDETSGDFAGDW